MANNTLTTADIKHLSNLANLPLTEDETVRFGVQLPQILDYVKEVQSLEIADTSTHNLPPHSSFREDKVTQSLSQAEALQSAPRTHNGYFVVAGVLNND
jgi:aspartyl-tRNA(Asn)/glutamyl-tRNA(Gln) amidotransferase subunit C